MIDILIIKIYFLSKVFGTVLDFKKLFYSKSSFGRFGYWSLLDVFFITNPK